MPPPTHQSSLNKKRKCEDEQLLNRLPSKSNCNSTEISFPSIIPNSQESTNKG